MNPLAPTAIGNQTEAIVLAELVKRGYTVYVPFGSGTRCDFIVDSEGQLEKVQCKTGRLRNGVVKFATVSTEKKWANKTTTRTGYSGQIDVFVVYCPETDKIYRISVDEATAGYCSLRVEASKNNQNIGVKWASDFEI